MEVRHIDAPLFAADDELFAPETGDGDENVRFKPLIPHADAVGKVYPAAQAAAADHLFRRAEQLVHIAHGVDADIQERPAARLGRKQPAAVLLHGDEGEGVHGTHAADAPQGAALHLLFDAEGGGVVPRPHRFRKVYAPFLCHGKQRRGIFFVESEGLFA